MFRKTALFALCILAAPSLQAKGFRLHPGWPLRDSATVYDVKGRQGLLIRQKLRFGPYETPFVKRSAIRSWRGATGAPGIFVAEHMQGRQSIRFALTNSQDTIHAETVTRVQSTDLIFGDNRNSLPNVLLDVLSTGTARQQNNFSAEFTDTRNGEVFDLFLDNTAAQLRRKEAAGFLRSASTYYTIVPVWEVERKGKVAPLLFGAAGLELQDEAGQTVAAVSLIDNGEVYLYAACDDLEKLLLSAACSALLLQSEIE